MNKKLKERIQNNKAAKTLDDALLSAGECETAISIVSVAMSSSITYIFTENPYLSVGIGVTSGILSYLPMYYLRKKVQKQLGIFDPNSYS